MAALLAALLAATSGAAAGPHDGDIAALQSQIAGVEGEIADAQARIGTIEAEIAALNDLLDQGDQAVDELEAAVAEAEARIDAEERQLRLLPVRIELLADVVIDHYLQLEEPTQVRHAMAIDSYVQNDERMNAVLTQSAELTGEALDGLRTQMMYEAVIDSATDDLAQVYAHLRLDSDRALTLYDLVAASEDRHRVAVDDRQRGLDEIPVVEGRIASSEGEITDAAGRIDAARAEIEQLAASIADTRAEIARLESLNVAKAWTGRQGWDVDRPALAVKIDNATSARPQTAINDADVVYEEKVEAGLTRFIAVFQTTSPGTVGPVRSARTSDPILLVGFDRPLFAFSGANRGTNEAIDASSLVDVGWDEASSAYWRSSHRRPPHNLYASTDRLWAEHPDRTDRSPAPFEFGWQGQPLHGSANPASGVTIDFGRLTADYAWNGSGWERSTNGQAHTDADGVRVAPANVVVQFVEYGWSAADSRSPEARTVGSGTAWVFTAGHLIVAEWHRPDPGRPATITVDGEVVLLQPGNTWVALADADRPGNVSWR